MSSSLANRTLLLWLLAVGLMLSACSAGNPSETAVAVEDPWARSAPAGMNSAVYFVVENQGPTDRLLSASTGVAEVVELHMSMMDDQGVMSMMEQEAVEIPSGEMVSFEPGGLHVMLIGLTRELSPGDTFPIVLQFEGAGQVEVVAEVMDQ
jgi:copper(I)-binding protein